MSAPDQVTTTLAWIESLKELKELVQEGDVAAAAKLAPSLIDSVPSAVDNGIVAALYETHCKCLLHQKEYQKVVDICQTHGKDAKRFEALRLYALYRLERFEEVREASRKATEVTQNNLAVEHIHAQSLFHLAATKDAIKQYQTLLNACTDDEQRMEVFTNLAATLAANATPYVRSAMDSELANLRQQMQAFLDAANDESVQEYPHDLAYNLATWELTTSAVELHRWNDLLGQAQKACTAQFEEAEATDLQRDLAPITANLEWSRNFWAGTSQDFGKPASGQPASVLAVRKLNRAFAATHAADGLKTLSAQPDSSLTPLQKRIFRYNQAVLQLREGNTNDCRQTCQTLLQSLPPLSNTQKKKQKQNGADTAHQQPTASEEDLVWWESRIAVLLALCSKRQGKVPEAQESLQTAHDKLKGMEATAIRDHALAYVQLHSAVLSDKASSEETIELLQDLPESIRSRKAVIASLASIYHEQGKTKEAEKLLRDTGDDQALADFAMSQGNYADAAALYEKAAADTQDPVATARWVHALSFSDPERAQEIWLEASPDLVKDQDVDVDGAELEERELPRLKTGKARKTDALAVDNEPTKSKKSIEAVMRRRTRKREGFLSVLQDKGLYRVDRPTKPDPERWLPKYERSYARRRRNRGGTHKGAQGGVSEKDAAKLDVAARQVARASGQPDSSGPSTAHMTVTAAGGARKGKSGKRR